MAIALESKPTNTNPIRSKTKGLEAKRRSSRIKVANRKKKVTFDLSLNWVVNYDLKSGALTQKYIGQPQVVSKGKRHCSKCQKIGHNARTCIRQPKVVSKGKRKQR